MLLKLKEKEFEFDFDIYDVENADKYEEALKEMEEASQEPAAEGMADEIRRQCEICFDFIDDVLGEGTSIEIFGEKTNLRDCLKIVEQIIDNISVQSEDFKKERNMIKKHGVATNTPAPAPVAAAIPLNREQRRAQRKAERRAGK